MRDGTRRFAGERQIELTDQDHVVVVKVAFGPRTRRRQRLCFQPTSFNASLSWSDDEIEKRVPKKLKDSDELFEWMVESNQQTLQRTVCLRFVKTPRFWSALSA